MSNNCHPSYLGKIRELTLLSDLLSICFFHSKLINFVPFFLIIFDYYFIIYNHMVNVTLLCISIQKAIKREEVEENFGDPLFVLHLFTAL